MPIIRPEGQQYGHILKLMCCNSQKSATIKRSVFQIGLRLPNGVFYGDIIFRRIAGGLHTYRIMVYVVE